MSITKTKNNTYRLRLYIPDEAKAFLQITGKMYEKTFKTRREAKQAELEILTKVENILSGELEASLETNGDILFSDFYTHVWWDSYKAGQTTSTIKPPSRATIDGTEIVFRKTHLTDVWKLFT